MAGYIDNATIEALLRHLAENRSQPAFLPPGEGLETTAPERPWARPVIPRTVNLVDLLRRFLTTSGGSRGFQGPSADR